MKPILYIDKNCTFCRSYSHKIVRFLGLKNKITLDPIDIQGTQKASLYMAKNNSWALKTNTQWYNQYDVWVQLIGMSHYKWTQPFWNLQSVKYIGRQIYKYIARKRTCTKKS